MVKLSYNKLFKDVVLPGILHEVGLHDDDDAMPFPENVDMVYSEAQESPVMIMDRLGKVIYCIHVICPVRDLRYIINWALLLDIVKNDSFAKPI